MFDFTDTELASVASRVFVDTAFLLTEPGGIWEPDFPDAVHALIGFESGAPGELVVSFPNSVACQLAADMLGVEPEDPEAVQSAGNAVAEMANVLAGVLMVQLFGEDGQWELGLPRIEVSAPRSTLPTACRIALQTDSGDQIQVSITRGEAA